MTRKISDDLYGKEETKRRFEAALRGARVAGPKPMKSMSRKRGKMRPVDDPMPKDDPEALVQWGKRNIQSEKD